MKQLKKNLAMYICMFMAVFCAMTLKTEAANVTTGTLGDNDGITWIYDADTKTLTVTGEDSGLQGAYYSGEYTYKSQFLDICEDVEVIKMQNCTLKGDTEYMFAYLKSLKRVEFQDVNTTNVTDMQYMFYNCSNLISLDLSNFDTSNVTDMSGMFSNCSSLSSLNVSSFNTSNVKDMSSMFGFCSSLSNLDVSNFNTSKVTAMYAMFNNCSSLNSLDVSNFDTSNVTFIYIMFYNCSSLNSLDVSNFDLSKVQAASSIFDYCKNLAFINIPKAMPAGMTITLPGTFVDVKGNEYTSMSSIVCGKTLYAKRVSSIIAFAERMYTIVLGRAAEEQGLSDWTERLLAKEIDGATLVDMFVNSDEFVNRNTSDEEYIKVLYRAVLGREADADGLKMWKAMLADDWTRDYILEGLVLSTEFKNICDSYGIIAAFEPTAESQVRSFVKRMYTVVLNRRADAVGLEDWTKQLMNGTVNGAKVADGFINSQEFANRNLSNEKYVKVLYRAFFNREPDEGGFNVWMNELAKGTSRREVMKGFVHSVEFSDLCAAYGIIRGEIQ